MKIQFIIIAIVVLAATSALLVFSGVIPGVGLPGSGPEVPLVVWGTLPANAINPTVSKIRQEHREAGLSYVEKPAATIESDLLNALATDKGPDIVILPPELAFKHRDKFLNLAGKSFTERIFKDTFVDGAEIFLAGGEIRALPFLIDPLLLYWNRDLLRNESFSRPPETWDEFLSYTSTLTKVDEAGNITTSGAALGLETNVRHFKEILSMLILQTGNPIVETPSLQVVLSRESASSQTPAENALRFYTEFARQNRASYSWSKAQPSSREAFAAGTLAMYFGFGSEASSLRSQNPHLNFDLGSPPQIRGGRVVATYGRIYSLGVPVGAKNPEAASSAIVYLLEQEALGAVSEKLSLAPARRDMLSEKPSNPILETIYREAVRAKSWPEADSQKISEMFGNMIRFVYSGAKGTNNAVRDAELQLQELYPQ